jgi:HK97 family phage major capsid protein
MYTRSASVITKGVEVPPTGAPIATPAAPGSPGLAADLDAETMRLAGDLQKSIKEVVAETKTTRQTLVEVKQASDKRFADMNEKDEETRRRLAALEKDMDPTQTDAFKAYMDSFQKMIARQLAVNAQAGKASAVVSLPGVLEDGEKFMFSRVAQASMRQKSMGQKAWDEYAPFEHKVIQETTAQYLKQMAKVLPPEQMEVMTKAALGTDVDAAGGYLVPTQVLAELIPLLRAQSVVSGLARTIDGLAGYPVRIPRQSGGATHYWGAQNQSLTPSIQATDEVLFVPHQSYVFCQMSQRLVALANPSVESMVREDIALIMALGEDLGFIEGSGASNEPLGICNQPSIGAVTSIGTPTNAAKFDDMVYTLEAANALRGNLAFVWHPRTGKTLRNIAMGTGAALTYATYAYRDELAAGRFLGHPVRTTTQIATNLGGGTNESRALFANWLDVIVASWAGMRVQATDVGGDAFAKDQVWIKAVRDVDIGLRHAASVCLGSGITA